MPTIPRLSNLLDVFQRWETPLRWGTLSLVFLVVVLLVPLVLVSSRGTRQTSGLASYTAMDAAQPTQATQATLAPMTRTTQLSRGYLLEWRPTRRHYLPPAPTWAPAPSALRPKPKPRPVHRPAVHRPSPTPAPKPKPQSIPGMIYAAFGPQYGAQALRVARCESSLNPNARSTVSTAKGLFQFLDSTWRGSPYWRYSPYNAWASIQAAHWLFTRDGYSWREWECQP